MDIRKVFWAIRGVIYKLQFGRFGKLSYIGKPVSIRGKRNIFVEDRVRIYPGIRMEAIGDGRIRISEGTSIGQNVHITAEENELVIGKNVTILGNTFVTNIDHDYRKIGTHILRQKRIIKKTFIGDNCFIGMGAAIQAGTILGKQCIVGANAVVRGVYPDCCVLVGAPAKIVRKYSETTGKWERIE